MEMSASENELSAPGDSAYSPGNMPSSPLPLARARWYSIYKRLDKEYIWQPGRRTSAKRKYTLDAF